MQKFIEKLQNLVAENEAQDATKQAIIDIAHDRGAVEAEKVLESAIVNTQNPLDRLFYEKMFKMLDSSVVTKRLIAEYSIN